MSWSPDNSLLRQELIASGLLIGAHFNLCLAHADADVEHQTEKAVDRACTALSDHLKSDDPPARLRGMPIRPIFQVRQ